MVVSLRIYFERATNKLNINRYFSCVKMAKDNPQYESFNPALQNEWLCDDNLHLECVSHFHWHIPNGWLIWLVEYSFNHPHQELDCSTPIEHIEKGIVRIRGPDKVLPMWSVAAGN